MHRATRPLRIVIADPPRREEPFPYHLPTMGILYLLGAIKQAFSAQDVCVSYLGANETLDSHLRRVAELKPDLYGLSFKTQMARIAYRTLNAVKERFPKLTVIAGGQHVSAMAAEVMDRTTIDAGFRGECEESIVSLIESFDGQRLACSPIPGAVYHDSGQIVSNPVAPLRAKIDQLNRTVRIYTRERRTVALLRKLGVNAERISLAPDIAFCLPATPAEQGLRCLPADPAEELARRRGPLIGISLSSLMMGLPEVGGPEYIATMARIVLFLRKKYGARVLLVPHVVTPRTWGGCDDAGVATELMKAIGPLSGISAVEGDVTASELKALIAQCELFLGARMHAAIAALSSGVPTIMLSWSHKYAGLMEEIGLGRFVWNIGASPSVLEELIDEAWNSRNAIREVLHAYNGRAQHLVRLEVARVLEIGQRAAGRRLDATVPHIRPDRIQNDPRVVRPIQTLLDHSPGSASQTGP